MLIYIIIMIILNQLMFASIWYTRQKMHVLEICANWMFICIIIQQIFTILTINLRYIVITEGVGVFWFLIMNRLIIYPSLIFWLFYLSKNKNLLYKVILTVIWLFPLASIQSLSNKFGLITFSNWNFICSLAEWLLVITLSFCFLEWFRYLLKKEEIIV
jgi:hypothetical protein